MTVRKVYFNSTCPVCNAGVKSQRAKMTGENPSCAIEWIDINDDPDALAERGVTLDDVRLKLYTEDDEQKLHIGAAAFASLWQETPSQRALGRFVSLPVIAPLSRLAYNVFAALLYRWNRWHGRW
jgi:predicted DCC family thiol-disulfide oxidoreductase YuxK